VVSHTPKSESPITIKSVPTKKRRLERHSGHRFDWIPHEFTHVTAHMTDLIHRLAAILVSR